MKLRKLLFAALFAFSTQASAVIVENVHLEFASGATYDGTITFNDGYQGMIDTDGMLTGGANNFNEHFTWTWWDGTGQTNPNNSFGLGYVDWLMNGAPNSWGFYIGLTWDAALSALDGRLSLVNTGVTYTHGIDIYNDPITSYRTGSGGQVPEPGSLALLGLGAALLGMARRRRSI